MKDIVYTETVQALMEADRRLGILSLQLEKQKRKWSAIDNAKPKFFEDLDAYLEWNRARISADVEISRIEDEWHRLKLETVRMITVLLDDTSFPVDEYIGVGLNLALRIESGSGSYSFHSVSALERS